MNKRYKTHRGRSQAGFSLIEVLVILIIIGVLFAIAAPGWWGFIGSRRANASRDQVLQVIRSAQADAVRTRTPRQVFFETAFPPSVRIRGAQGQTGQTIEVLGNGEFRQGMITLEPEVPFIEFTANGTIDYNNFPSNGITIAVEASTGARRCVIIQTLLGATRSGNTDQECTP